MGVVFVNNTKIMEIYLLVQAIIWAKCLVFFQWFGSGTIRFFNAYKFSAWAVQFDFLFHQSMHVAIAILAIGFGLTLKKTGFPRLLALVFVAVALHNVAYWLTSFASFRYHFEDFFFDCTLLLLFVLLGVSLKKIFGVKENV